MVLRCANVFRIALVIPVLVILFAGFASAADKIELRGEVYDGINIPNVVGGNDPSGNPVNLSWNAINFPYPVDMKFGITGSSRLLISYPVSDLSSSRYIPEQRLWYITDRIIRNFTVYDQKGLTVAGNSNYSMFYIIGMPKVAVKHNLSKRAHLVFEQDASVSRNLTSGESWDMGAGYVLKAVEINATSARLALSRNDVELDNKTVVLNSTYVTTQNLVNETNVPIFVTYLDSVVLDSTNKAILKYTWLISTDVVELKAGDIDPINRVMRVWSVDSNSITLTNQIGLTLARDSAIRLFGPPPYQSPSSPDGFKLKVADSDVLRFYPVLEITTPGIYEVRGKISESGSTKTWDVLNFGGLWYDFQANLATELIEISPSESLTSADRTIDENNLNYSTFKVLRQYQVHRYTGWTVQGGLDSSGNKVASGGFYAIVGWGKGYVAVNGKANKLAKLILEHGSAVSDKKTLTVGETWDMGDGYTLTAQSIDAKATPRQVWLVFSKDGVKLEDKVVSVGQVYTYTASIAGESDVPIFVTYIDSIFAGANTDMVQVRYTWLISSNVIELRAGDVFGAMKVIESSDNQVKLKNVDTAITLSSDSVVDIMGNLKFRVADNASVLRFYPFVTYEISQPPLVLPPQPFDTLEFEPNIWNLVSVPKTLNNSAVDIALNNLSFDLNNVKWYYNTTTNAWEHPSNIMPLRGYWVYSNVSSKIIQKLKYKNMAGPNVPPSMLMKAGWNLIGHTSTEAMQVKSALISIDGKYSHLLTYDPIKGWRFYIVGNPSLQQFDAFEPGRGYWIFMTQDATYAAVDV